MNTRIVMVGTSPQTHGGISSVVNAWRAGGLFARWSVDYVASHCDGSRVAKALCAAEGLLIMLGLAIRHRDALVHIHGASRASFWRKAVYMTVAMLAGWDYIFHLHGGGFARFYKECGPVGRAAVRFFLRHAAAIVVVSQRWAAWMRSVVRHPRIAVIANPVAVPAPAAAREPALVAFIGRCEPAKGIVELLKAIAIVKRDVPGIRLECAGDGDLRAMNRMAEKLGIGDNVRFLGWLGEEERQALLARATVFALPSHAEGQPVSLLEAMAAGCPVVASAVGGIPDVVTHSVNGLLFAPRAPSLLANALRRVVGDPAFAARLAAEARATIDHRHSIDKSLDTLEQLYAELGASRSEARARPSPRRLQEIS